MKAYKFRSAGQIAFALDIILNNRLFCSGWKDLNDPMEGIFACSGKTADKGGVAKLVDQIIRKQQRIKICSLSTTFDSHLLWSHYAGGFDGVAVEVELPDRDPRVRSVAYGGVFAYASLEDGDNPMDMAKDILSSKYLEWGYEKEARILSTQKWFKLKKPVSAVIAGHRMPPALFEGLRLICESKGIAFRRTGIGDEGIDADAVYPA